MKNKPLFFRDEEFKSYAEMMAEELKKAPREKRPVSTQQCASTKRLLAMSDEEHAKHLANGSDTLYWQELKEKSKADKYYQREITPVEEALHKKAQRSQKNVLGSGTGTSTEEAKHRAKEAWSFSPGKTYEELTNAEKLRVKKEIKIETPQIVKIEKPKKLSWFKRLFAAPEPMSFAEKLGMETPDNYKQKDKK